MADKEKSIIERALMDAKRIQETLNANTKEILRSVAKEEIDGLVKESLTEESYVEEEINPTLNEEEKEEEIEDVELEDEESENEEESEKEDENEEEMESDEEEMDSEEEENDNEELTSDEQEPMFGDEEEMDSNMDDETGEDFEEIDMTDSSDINDVISIYKKLTGDDEIEVVFDKEDDEMEVKVTEPGEFIVKNVSNANNAEEEEEVEEEFNAMDESDIMYEIEMDEDYMNEETEETHGEEEEEDTMEESNVRALSNGRNQTLKPSTFPDERRGGRVDESEIKQALTEAENKYNTLLTETKELKNKNEEYKQALKNFRTMLAETVVFNSNLTYVTKLFMEHSTTKEEKQNILKRFDDEVTTIKESKRLYKTIANELSSKTPIKESVEKSLVKEATSSTSKQIHESTAYVDKETQRIMDLMRRVENR